MGRHRRRARPFAFANRVARQAEGAALSFAQGAHPLETLDRRLSGLHRFETAHRFDPLLQFAVVGLHDVVQIIDLAVLNVLRAPALLFELADGLSVSPGLVSVNRVLK
jgi:hypothetical protein